MKKENIITIDNLTLPELDSNAEFIPLLTPEEEEEMSLIEIPDTLCILPLRNLVLFPGVVIPITAGRSKSMKAIEYAQQNNQMIGVVAQKNEKIDDPTKNDLYEIGTIAKILKVVKLPNGNYTVLLQGQRRFHLEEIFEDKPFIKAIAKPVSESFEGVEESEFPLIIESIKDVATDMIHSNENIPSEMSFIIKNIESGQFLINFVSSNMQISVEEKQSLLERFDLRDRALATLQLMQTELQKLKLKNDIQHKTRMEMDNQQKEYFLNQQIKTIQEELGGGTHEAEIEDMKKRGKQMKWNAKTNEHFEKELSKMQRLHHQSPDFALMRNYLELMLELPWNVYSEDVFDLKKAKELLDKEHYGLENVKKRILEHMAVLKLRNDMKSPILCLYGPPGVGKTSIGKSIADALGREYVRFSLGGLRDEAEIRGHRKTYIGAMPGRILQNLKKAKTSNPVFVLDEIDKLSNSHNGDPSSALLEVLDPEQNKEFYDNFLEIGYDLSKVMFVATSNSLNTIQPALLDRMEIIEMNGYTIEEKVEITKQHLLPNQLKEHGLDKKVIQLGKKQLEFIISRYTRESGVRSLNKLMAQIARFIAKSLVMEEEFNSKPTEEDIITILGVPKFDNDMYENNETSGVVTGLAWTRVGGDILYIESILSEGKGGLTMTGNLGTVMKESATIALEYIKAYAEDFGIKPELFEKYKVHVHVPEGATPKDGPSAGIAMLTAMVSAFTQKRVKKNLAMTGEITLRGKVLPVGGIKEKILAAKRANIKEIILCKQNQRDVEKINPDYIKGLTFHYVDHMEEVLNIAITNQKVKNYRKKLEN